jgi:hypothetical protein
MKIKALRRALARLIDPSATSVSPKNQEMTDFLHRLAHPPMDVPAFLTDPSHQMRAASEPDTARKITGGLINIDPRGKTREQIEAEIVDQINAIRARSGMTARPVEAPEIAAVMEQVDAAMALRIPDSELEAIRQKGPGPILHSSERPSGDDISWQQWVAMRDHTLRDGWTFCRLGVRMQSDKCFQAFGIVRGDFGVYWNNMWACPDHEHVMVACLIHLKTGGGIGVFEDMRLACDAADSLLAMRDITWADVDPMNEASYGALQPRIESAWRFCGIMVAPSHVHEVNGITGDMSDGHTLFMREDQPTTPKEKLS